MVEPVIIWIIDRMNRCRSKAFRQADPDHLSLESWKLNTRMNFSAPVVCNSFKLVPESGIIKLGRVDFYIPGNEWGVKLVWGSDTIWSVFARRVTHDGPSCV